MTTNMFKLSIHDGTCQIVLHFIWQISSLITQQKLDVQQKYDIWYFFQLLISQQMPIL